MMSDIENKVVDNYKEHNQHPKGTWGRNMKNCSECFKAHTEFKRKSNLFRKRGNSDIGREINLVGNPELSRY